MPSRFRLAAAVLLASSVTAQGVAEGAEPNGSAATATALANGLQAYGEISTADADWFEITLTAAADYRIWTGPGFSGQIGNTRVRLLASDGVTVLADVDDGGPATHGLYTVFDGSLASGTYYVEVRGFTATATGSYTLDVALAPPGTYVPPAPVLTAMNEGPENNDPRPAFGGGTPSLAGFDTQVLGNIAAGGGNGTSITSPGKDYDWYKLSVTTPGSYVFRTTATPTAPAPFVNDTVLHLCDGAYQRLAFNDDFGGTWSQLTYYISTPGTYYVVVSGYFGISAGSYYLDILDLPPSLPIGPAVTVIHPGGCAGSAGTPRLETRLSSTGSGVRPERPVLGSQYWLDGRDLPANALVFAVIGFVAHAVPIDLTGFGAPGCQVEVDPIDWPIALADGNGDYFWAFALPSGLSFLGLPIEQQLVVHDPAANALGVTVSNRVSSVFGITH